MTSEEQSKRFTEILTTIKKLHDNKLVIYEKYRGAILSNDGKELAKLIGVLVHLATVFDFMQCYNYLAFKLLTESDVHFYWQQKKKWFNPLIGITIGVTADFIFWREMLPSLKKRILSIKDKSG